MLFRLRFIHYAMVSPFILYCFSFLFDWWTKMWEICWRGVDELYGLHHANDQMHMYVIASSIEIIILSAMFLPYTDSNQPGWLHNEIYICKFLGCDLPIKLLIKSLSSILYDRLVDCFYHVKIHIASYKIYNNLCLNK